MGAKVDDAGRQQLAALFLGQTSPDAESLAEGQRMLAALSGDRALFADQFRGLLALPSRDTAFTVGVKEDRRIRAPTPCLDTPFPVIGTTC